MFNLDPGRAPSTLKQHHLPNSHSISILQHRHNKPNTRAMPFVSNLGTNPLARQENAPLPYDDVLDTTPIVFQKWHERDDSTNKWAPLPPLSDYTAYTPPFQPSATESRPQTSSDLTFVTWNIDASSPSPEARIAALASLILSNPVDVILLQEVSKAALAWLLDNSAIRQGWLVSDADTSS